MIGSFWNLCRACPSMPVDKLHSEYRSTYRWHEYTGPRQEVVRRAPTTHANIGANSDERSNEVHHTARIDEESYNELPKLEPALPRRKKHPDLAYRHHEFLVCDGSNASDSTNFAGNDRARSLERGVSHWRPSRRSKSEGPARTTTLMNRERRRDSDPDLENTGRDQGLLQKAISKISTEYRLQFAWPQGHTSRKDAAGSTPRKSLSMNAIKPPANAMIHKRRPDFEPRDASELEPLVNDNNAIQEEEKFKDLNTEYQKKFRPFSQYEYSESNFKSKTDKKIEDESKHTLLNGSTKEDWYKEMVELRKKAGEYKHRGWGTDFTADKLSDVYNKQVELWDQVSRRSTLSALSLASITHRNYTKEEKDQENTKKSSPTKAQRNAENSARMVRDIIRHHLGRTTGELDGLILSPTREKLEPTIPRKDDDSRSSQKNSPKKNSPQKLSLQRKSKSKSVPRTVRSQSVGPVEVITEKRSPKRQSRSATVKEKKTSTTNWSTTRRPRPSSLNTTASSRSKCRSAPIKTEDERSTKTKSNKNQSSHESQTHRPKNTSRGNEAEPTNLEKCEKEKGKEEEAPPLGVEVVNLEPVVKSPPEPTRVKSPEQIIMRSPDPVNWTVPLDTGKTFTVTQNVREGDIGARPQSEVKAWTPPEIPPPVAQSAPPELPQQKEQVRRGSYGMGASELLQHISPTPHIDPAATSAEKTIRLCGKPVKDTSLRCLDDPFSEYSSIKTVTPQPKSNTNDEQNLARSFASDVLEKARNRFDSFWRKNSKEESS